MEGECDNPAYIALTDKLLKIAGAEKLVIAGAAHLINLDQPKEFNDAVLEFLGNS
jgi:pimeloyl-ACP methyl ester carboxylesterase